MASVMLLLSLTPQRVIHHVICLYVQTAVVKNDLCLDSAGVKLPITMSLEHVNGFTSWLRSSLQVRSRALKSKLLLSQSDSLATRSLIFVSSITIKCNL